MNNVFVQFFSSLKSFAVLLFVVSLAFTPCYADELDDFLAAKKQACQDKIRELERKSDLVRASIGSQSSGAQPPADISEHLAATAAIISQLKSLVQKSPSTAAEKAAYAASLSSATAQSSIAKRALDRDLHIDPASVIDRLVDQNALSTFGKGSPSSIVGFDGSQKRTAHWEVATVGGPQPFQPQSPPVTVAQYTPITVQEAVRVQEKYGSIPQGVALEGVATGLGEIRTARYEQAYNAIVLDDRAAYFVKIAPWTLVTLCRAIAKDDQERVGVSYGRVFQPYGKVPLDSTFGQDLILTDKFLADMVFAADDWTAGYRFKDGFVPEKRASDGANISVSFTFYGFQFDIRQQTVISTRSAFDVKLYPISDTPAKDGGAQPDTNAISAGRTFPEYERNARHLTDNIDYYRHERVVERTFMYAEAAAFLRGLKAAHVDLEKLATEILAM